MKSTLLMCSENVFLQAVSTMEYLQLVVFEKIQQTIGVARGGPKGPWFPPEF